MATAPDPGAGDRPRGALRRELRLIDAVGIGLGAVIGAGIFVVTGVAAGVAGPAFLLGLVIAALAATCNGLSSAQLAAIYPESGGTYEYGYRVLHPWLGFAAGWMFLASKLAATGTVALGFGAYVAHWLPDLSPRVTAFGAVGLLTVANLFGIKKAGRFNLVIVGVTLLALTIFVVAGIPAFDASRLRPFAPSGWSGVIESAALMFFAFTGYARLATLGEEVHEPRRTIARAIIATLILSALLYFAVALVAVGAVGSAELARTSSPLQVATGAFSWPGAGPAVAVGATTAMLGVLLSQILGISRMMLAMSRRRDLPGRLEHIHPVYAVPDRGIWLTGAIVVVVVLIGELKTVVSAAAFTILLYYGITNLAALRLSREQRLYPHWIAGVGLLVCTAMAAALPWETIGTGGLLLVLGFVLRGWMNGS
jgi:APA family basic amino acid/polyamine antiporter